MKRESTKRKANPTHPHSRIHLLGAAGTVTGSKFLVEYFAKNRTVRFLFDIGQHQGSEQSDKAQWPKGITPSMIDFTIITHAHIDHSGLWPKLIKDGNKGFAYATPATKDLLKILLPDSGHIQELDAIEENRKRRKGPRVRPLYTMKEAKKSLERIKTIEYNTPTTLAPGVVVTFTQAAHILGAAVTTVVLGTGEDQRVIVDNGNIGRPNTTLLKPLKAVRKADVLLIESTYGNVLHDRRDRLQALADTINDGYKRALKKHQKFGYGKILIPAFAVGRVQAVLYDLRQLMEEGRIPVIPVFLDSPMASKATQVYRDYHKLYNNEARAIVARGVDPISTPKFFETRKKDQSELLQKPSAEPVIIIGSSGMATGGRIRGHIERCLPGAQNTVLFVGHQEEGALGYELVNNHPKSVVMDNNVVNVNATIALMQDYSGHADYEDSIAWLKKFETAPTLTVLKHGEPEGLEGFKTHIEQNLPGWKVEIGKSMQAIDVR
ncbi:MAG TPA: MBL fold metallo-hydrolase [Planktothrix sp.]